MGATRAVRHVLCLLTGLAALVPGWAQTPQPAATKVLEWRFEGDLHDTSGRGNDGKMRGTGGFVPGRFGRALSRSAGTMVTRKDAYDVPLLAAEAWSINCWLRIVAMPGWSRIAGFRDASDSWGTLRLISDEGGFSLYGHNSLLNSRLPFADDGAWHMYTATWDGATMALYLDGEPKATGKPLGDGYSGLADLRQADVILGDTGDWVGAVDEFTIWRGALPSEQVRSLLEHNGPG